jgi:hypothetical protein
MDPIILKWSTPGIAKYFPTMTKLSLTWQVFNGTLHIIVIGICYFASNQLNLSMGLNMVFYSFIAVVFYKITGSTIMGTNVNLARYGATIFYGLLIFYTGRSFYLPVLKRALGFGKPAEEQVNSVYAARIFLLSSVLFIVMLKLFGMSWLIAVVFTCLLLIGLLAFTRIICETGIPNMSLPIVPASVLTGLFGTAVFGTAMASLVYYMSCVFTTDAHVQVMTLTSTGVKVAEKHEVNLKKFFNIGMVLIVLFVVIGTAGWLWKSYSYGAAEHNWWYNNGWFQPLNKGAREIVKVKNMGILDAANQAVGLEKLKFLNIKMNNIIYFLAGGLGVLLFSMLRFRFSWWPFHPVIFLILNVWRAKMLAASFLIGWFIKLLVIKFGGGMVYNKLKPLFAGLIVGSVAFFFITIIIGMIYTAVTGDVPPAVYKIM